MLSFAALLSGSVAVVIPQDGAVAPRTEPDFARDVRPLFEARCFSCHGETKQKGGLRLDRRADAFAGAQFGAEPVLVPGDALASTLYQRLVTDVEDERMPQKGEPLTAAEVARVRAWIDAGAPWPDEHAGADAHDASATHWAWRAPVRPAVPDVRDVREREWVKNPIDAFLLARFERDGLAHAPEASRERLLRRVTLDLTGLAPTVEELDRFLADPRPDAYEREVERLLASPRYGEHFAVAWLDLARYADTHGYEKDDRRTQWRWRDWVIDALNRDVPFDRFTVEQLAGDLLPDANDETRLATAFHRNTLINEEGGTDPEEFRAAALVDRVNTTASVWLASTLACAQCHNHKYDPFSAKDYYRFLAYFDQSADTGNARAPELVSPTREQAAELATRRAELSGVVAALEAPQPEWDAREARWRTSERARLAPAPSWRVARWLGGSARSGARLAIEADGSVSARAATSDAFAPDANDVYDFEFEPGAGRFGALRLEALTDPAAPSGGPGRAANGNFVVTELEVWRASGDTPLAREAVALVGAEADYEQRGPGTWEAALAIDGDPATGWAGGVGERPGARDLSVLFAEPIECDASTRIHVRLRQEWPGGGHALGRVRIAVADGAELASRVRALVASPWSRTGPYPADSDEQSARAQFDLRFPPEAEVLGGAARELVAWRAAPELTDGVVHELDHRRGTYYFARTFECLRDGELELFFGSDDALVVWWNGERVLESRTGRGAALDQDRVRVATRAGTNRLFVKVVNYQGRDGFAFRFDAARAGGLPRDVAEALRAGDAEKDSERARAVTRYFRTHVEPEGRALAERRVELERALAAFEARLPRVMVLQERATPRETRIYTRGDFRNPGERVEPGTPALFSPLAAAPANRLGLAQWLVDPANPLVARVAVNRLWERCFGVGIVPTSDDFGTRGDPPTYPELLDWLACEFVARGWSQKELLRLIVTSAAYRQDSRVTSESFEADPENRRFSRGPRRRVDAEAVRDVALQVSGLLVERLGGPSVFPPQPAGIWNLPYNGDQWRDDEGEGRYRRGLYTFARRSAPYPTFNTFDAPSRELSCTRRPRSNTPLQALVLLNDPAFVECAGGFARRIVARVANDRERAKWAFRAATSREPSERELAIVLELLEGERTRFEREPEAALALCAASRALAASDAAAPATTDASSAPVDLAAWIVVASALLNLDETITKG